MECNKDEALRAKEIAEKKFTAKDISGAKKFAMKAKSLFPALEGIDQMIATLDVYLASELKVGGEKDWYAILHVSPSADAETLRKHYRKMVLQIHPDKNKFIGADGAFHLISDAWNVLSDKNMRLSYDQKRNANMLQQNASQRKKGNTAKDFHSSAVATAPKARKHKQTTISTAATGPQPSQPPKSKTFWTSCNGCKMLHEYMRIYINHKLICPDCHESFLAKEVEASMDSTNPTMPCCAKQQQKQDADNICSGGNAPSPDKSSFPISGTGASRVQQGGSLGSHSTLNPNSDSSRPASYTASVQAANVAHQTYGKAKKVRVKAQSVTRREEALRRKYNALNRSTNVSANCNPGINDSIASEKKGTGDDAEQAVSGARDTCLGSTTDFKFPGGDKHLNSSSGGSKMEGPDLVSGGIYRRSFSAGLANLNRSLLDIRGRLTEKTNISLHEKIQEWNHMRAQVEEMKNPENKQKLKEDEKEKGHHKVHGTATKQYVPSDGRNKVEHCDPSADSDNELNVPASIHVPDPDFHNFDINRTERSFQSDQIWATYDDKDGMPRYYAFIQKVLSLNPFKIRMSFLTSKSNSEFGPLSWVSSGFAKVCGDFRVGRYETNDTINMFSHTVKWEKGPRGIIRIFPRKGDTWALYRNWSPNWEEDTPDDVIYKYDIVEVLSDYSEDQGISVTPLVKVSGFKTVYRRQFDQNAVRMIPREEMFRFSHQVPSFELTGEEAHNAPKGCHDLDPAAMPSELLQVSDAKEEPTTS